MAQNPEGKKAGPSPAAGLPDAVASDAVRVAYSLDQAIHAVKGALKFTTYSARIGFVKNDEFLAMQADNLRDLLTRAEAAAAKLQADTQSAARAATAAPPPA